MIRVNLNRIKYIRMNANKSGQFGMDSFTFTVCANIITNIYNYVADYA